MEKKRWAPFLGYSIGPIRDHGSDIRIMTLRVRRYIKRTCAAELLDCVQYTDGSLDSARDKALAVRRHGLDYYLETVCYSGSEINFEFQGSVERRDWYACNVNLHGVTIENAAMLSAIMKKMSEGIIETPQKLILSLTALKATPVKDIIRGEGNYYPSYLTIPSEPFDDQALGIAPLEATLAA